MPVRERTTETSLAGSKVVSGWKRTAMRVPCRSTAEIRRRSHMDLRAAYSKRFSTEDGGLPKRSSSSFRTSCLSASEGDEEICVGALSGTTDAATQLVEFGEAEAVGAVDQNGVGAGNVQSVFDDGGGDEHVGFIADEFQHNAFEFFFGHLAVSNDNACFRHQFLHHGSERIDGFEAIVDEEDLAVAGEFGFDGGLDELFLEGSDDGLNSQTIARRRFDDGHVAKADERHVESARDGSRGESERVHILAHFLEAFFVGDAEALLFVNDEKAEVGEFDVFREQPMSTDNHIDLA